MRSFAPLLLILAGCGPTLHPEAPDAVLLVVIDTLRADHLGCYGYDEPTSPRLDALARQGVRFARATSHAPITQPSVTTILTGMLPFEHGIRDNRFFVLEARETTLAERAAGGGYRCAAVVGASVLARDRGLDQGFEHYDSEFAGDYPVYDRSLGALGDELARTRRRADRVTDLAIERLQEFGGDPWFLMVHYFDPHAHYDPPPEHREAFADPYDGEIHFVDRQIGRLLDAASGRRLLVAVVSDHGESFGEHGEIGHGFLLHESTLHVPMILSGHGVPAGELREDLVGLVDLEPTLAARMHLDPPRSPRTGRDLFGAPVSPSDQYAETLHTLLSYDWSPLRALRRDNLKWIEGPDPQLFDLTADPHERTPLPPSDPRVPDMQRSLSAWIADDDPLALKAAASEPNPERAEQLAALGYVGGEPSATLPLELPDPKDMLPGWNRRQELRAHYRSALTLLQLGSIEAAVALLDTVLGGEPGKVDALHNRATALSQLGRMDEARRDWQEAIERNPDYVPALSAFSEDRLAEGDLQGALGLLEALCDLEPDDPDHHYNLGVCADRLGRSAIARASLLRFLELAPADEARIGAVRQWLAQHPEGP